MSEHQHNSVDVSVQIRNVKNKDKGKDEVPLCLPEQAELGQQGGVGAAFLRTQLARRVVLGAQTFDLGQDLPGK